MKTPNWEVIEAVPQKDYTILLTFADGSRKVYDASPLLEKPLCSELKNLGFFLKGHVEYGTVVWNDDLDIAPEELYENGVPLEIE